LSELTSTIDVVGAGLAGCEAALQLARLGLNVRLHEMRPVVRTPAHRTASVAEIVCSNSLKSTLLSTAAGLLKAELEQLGCALLDCARRAALPAGSALAVDRLQFAQLVAQRLAAEPRIRMQRGEIRHLALTAGCHWVLATGPLTSPELQRHIAELTGQSGLHFFDAIAPTVTLASLDLGCLFPASRYGRGGDDYLNAPLNEAEYRSFQQALVGARKAEVRGFERSALFAGCLPIEEIAASGPLSLAHGPLRPVGLHDPRTGRRPFAVVQLRRENRDGTFYGLVGFQTRLAYGEQKRVFRLIPGLAQAEFVRLGQMHRNFYLDTPRVADHCFALRGQPSVCIAGQLTGVEGYVESIASGLMTAWLLAARLRNLTPPPWPNTTLCGALLQGFLFDKTAERLVPMNANFGLLPPLNRRVRGRREQRLALSERALRDLALFLRRAEMRQLLALTAQE
jgi:methylenetetrahydrofolate--tRNA-(uracil-5-)-methyltransferase